MLRKLLFLVLFGVVSSLLAVEALFRVVTMLASERPRWSDRPRYYFQAGDAPTLQDYRYDAQKPGDTFRVAVVGDSYSFAPYMQFTDAFPKVLERMLNLGPQRAEVINYGVPAYSTSHEIATTERAIKEGADLVVLQITLNDPEIKPVRPIGITQFNTWGPLELGEPWKTMTHYWRSLGYALERIHNESTKRRYVQYFIDLFEKPDTWANFESSVRQIVTKANEKQVRLVAVVFPLFGVPLDDQYPFHRCHEKAASLLKELGVPTLDLFSLYERIPLHRLQVIPDEDRHPNEIAHRMAGERIYDWLEELHAIPPTLQIAHRFRKRTQIVKEQRFVEEPSSDSPQASKG